MPPSAEDSQAPLSVIVPVLNGAPQLARTLDALGPARVEGLVREVIVVDGGSRDDSREVARTRGARVLDSAPGRGRQLRLGAAAAGAPWLFFLHADSRPDPDWIGTVRHFCASGHEDRAAVFRLRLDDTARTARMMERGVAWRTRALGLPYGDQGLLLSRRLYDAVGGYGDMPLMEDVDLVRRIGRRRILLLDQSMTTSAERYRRAGYGRRIARNLSILALYFAGVPPVRLARLYG